MGQKATKQDIQTKEKNNLIKQVSKETKKSELYKIKEQINNNQNNNTNQIISKETGHIQSQQKQSILVDTAIKQLDRDGQTLIKADLVAIIIRLKPDYLSQVHKLQTNFTVSDLNSLIRNIIYDPSFITNTTGQNQLVYHKNNTIK